MEASDSLPEFREWIFFIPFPFPNFGNGFFQFPSRSRILKSHSRSPLDLPTPFDISVVKYGKSKLLTA